MIKKTWYVRTLSLSLSLSNFCLTSTSTFKWYEISSFFIRIPPPTCVTMPTCCTNMSPSDEITERFLAFLIPSLEVSNKPPEAFICLPFQKGHNLKNLQILFLFHMLFFFSDRGLNYYLGSGSGCSKSFKWKGAQFFTHVPSAQVLKHERYNRFPSLSHFNIRIHWMHQQPYKTTRCAEVKSSYAVESYRSICHRKWVPSQLQKIQGQLQQNYGVFVLIKPCSTAIKIQEFHQFCSYW